MVKRVLRWRTEGGSSQCRKERRNGGEDMGLKRNKHGATLLGASGRVLDRALDI